MIKTIPTHVIVRFSQGNNIYTSNVLTAQEYRDWFRKTFDAPFAAVGNIEILNRFLIKFKK
jgi:hypothetical protein